jgi:hypothetical protein
MFLLSILYEMVFTLPMFVTRRNSSLVISRNNPRHLLQNAAKNICCKRPFVYNILNLCFLVKANWSTLE